MDVFYVSNGAFPMHDDAMIVTMASDSVKRRPAHIIISGMMSCQLKLHARMLELKI